MFYYKYLCHRYHHYMGNREALLVGQRIVCWTRGTRAPLRGTSQKPPGQFGCNRLSLGSKEALLTAALLQAIEEWDTEFRHALGTANNQAPTPMERFESTWTRMIASFTKHRQLWVANFELFAQIDHIPEVRQGIDNGLLQKARAGLVSLFEQIDEATVDERSMRTSGSIYYALLTGVLVQWLIDPAHAPSGHDLAGGLRIITQNVSPTSRSGDTRSMQRLKPPKRSASRQTRK
jgi:AcrR family transcriptional regulator